MQAHTTHAVDFIYHIVSILSIYKTGGKGCDGFFLACSIYYCYLIFYRIIKIKSIYLIQSSL
jgi:hypothetical protein